MKWKQVEQLSYGEKYTVEKGFTIKKNVISDPYPIPFAPLLRSVQQVLVMGETNGLDLIDLRFLFKLDLDRFDWDLGVIWI